MRRVRGCAWQVPTTSASSGTRRAAPGTWPPDRAPATGSARPCPRWPVASSPSWSRCARGSSRSGSKPPASDAGRPHNGGDGRYDIYLARQPSGILGRTRLHLPAEQRPARSPMVVDDRRRPPAAGRRPGPPAARDPRARVLPRRAVPPRAAARPAAVVDRRGHRELDGRGRDRRLGARRGAVPGQPARPAAAERALGPLDHAAELRRVGLLVRGHAREPRVRPDPHPVPALGEPARAARTATPRCAPSCPLSSRRCWSTRWRCARARPIGGKQLPQAYRNRPARPSRCSIWGRAGRRRPSSGRPDRLPLPRRRLGGRLRPRHDPRDRHPSARPSRSRAPSRRGSGATGRPCSRSTASWPARRPSSSRTPAARPLRQRLGLALRRRG